MPFTSTDQSVLGTIFSPLSEPGCDAGRKELATHFDEA
jgi:hypothetical protein